MNTLTDYQIINDKSGNPAFVVIPYEDFRLFRDRTEEDSLTIPDEVVGKTVMEGKSLLCAWREYRQIRKEDMARQMKMTLEQYDFIENDNPDQRHVRKAAEVLGIDARLLTDD